MRFTTASGSTYELTQIREEESGLKSAYLIRDGVPLVDITLGGEMPTMHAQRVSYIEEPTLGQSWQYFSATHAGCISTPIASIDEDEVVPTIPDGV